MRRKVALAATAFLVAIAAMACSPEDKHAFDEVNAFRKANGVAALQWEAKAGEKAVAWSKLMASQGRLSHSTLSDGIAPG